MIKYITAITLTFAAITAQAQAVAYISSPQGHRITLFSEQGDICKENALRAVFSYPNGATLEGCWTALPSEGTIQVVLVNAKVAEIPMEAFKKADAS